MVDWITLPEERIILAGYENGYNYEAKIGVRNVSTNQWQFQPGTIARNGDVLEFYFGQECFWYEYLKFESCEPETSVNVVAEFALPDMLTYLTNSAIAKGPGVNIDTPKNSPVLGGTMIGGLVPGKAAELRFQVKVVGNDNGQFAVNTQYAEFKKLPNGYFKSSVEVKMYLLELPIAVTGN